MRLTFVGKDPDSNPTGSLSVYRTDRRSWVVQGWLVTDPEALAQMDIPDGEACVEIPDSRVGSWRGGHRLRFQLPPVKPCMWFSHTRLSD
ncbi:MAG: hypothetical protein M3460_03905, partial [Actinomycetota bacterium]|nr:hypothetical protein [Actinomycetota bacterium]